MFINLLAGEHMKRSLLLLPLIFCAFLAAHASVQGTFQRSFQVTGPVDLEVLTHSGDITVRRGPAGSVQISAKIYASRDWPFSNDRTADVQEVQKNPPVHQSGNSIRIDYPNVRNLAIDYEITVPPDTTVRTHSGSGDQTVEGLQKGAELESGSGDMRLNQLEGAVHVHTGSGNVEARAISGAVDAEAGSGDIRVEEKGPGDVRVRTGSGNIELRDVNGALHAEAGSGDITAEGKQAGGWEIRTGSGNVDLRLPSEAAFDLDVSTSSGTLDVSHPVTMTVQGRVREHPHVMQGKVRGGGPLLTVHTGSGDVHID
jgi:DUF4097 and DUF4098 domain-containing protein YvlB